MLAIAYLFIKNTQSFCHRLLNGAKNLAANLIPFHIFFQIFYRQRTVFNDFLQLLQLFNFFPYRLVASSLCISQLCLQCQEILDMQDTLGREWTEEEIKEILKANGTSADDPSQTALRASTCGGTHSRPA